MKELEFIQKFKQNYGCGIDRSKYLTIHPEPEEPFPFIVKQNNKSLGCLYLHIDLMMREPMVWVMYLKSYQKGNGTKLLELICKEADAMDVKLYLEPAPDNDSRMNFYDLVAWYRRYGFTGEATMVRIPNA